MKVVLLKDVAKLGKKFDLKDVSDGHAINLLIPKGLVLLASESNLKKILGLKEKEEKEKGEREVVVAKKLKEIEKLTLSISGKANDKGHLFAGIHKDEIVSEIAKKINITIDPEFIVMDKPIKEVGEHTVEIKAGEKSAKFKVIISAIS